MGLRLRGACTRQIAHQQETADDRQIADGIDQETGGDPEDAEHDASQGRANQAPHIEERRIERDGIGEILSTDHLGDKCLPAWHVERVVDSDDECHQIDMPEIDIASPDEIGEGGREPSAAIDWVTTNRDRLGTRSATTPANRPRKSGAETAAHLLY